MTFATSWYTGRPALAQGFLAQFAPKNAPLSAIDWLSNSVAPPQMLGYETADIQLASPRQEIAVIVIQNEQPDSLGLLPTRVTGLPQNLWANGQVDTIAAQLKALTAPSLPAAQSFFIQLLLAESHAPRGSSTKATLLIERIDRLLEMGALEQAEGLINLVLIKSPALFRRSFDVALLTGHEDMACQSMRTTPILAPTYLARIFCLARDGDWAAAAITLRAAQSLGILNSEQDAILTRFLGSDLTEQDLPLSPPSRPSPLIWRLFEAVGEPLPTQDLPIAFAYGDLRIQSGYTAQVEAAERLAKAGVLAPNVLLGLYSDDTSAASGGVWGRVKAIQAFEKALATKNVVQITNTLHLAWVQMQNAGLEVPFANIYARRLAVLALPEPQADLAFHILLLSEGAQQIAQLRQPQSAFDALLIGLATGTITQEGGDLRQEAGRKSLTPQQGAVAKAFTKPLLPHDLQQFLDQNRYGEAILSALALINRGASGDNAALCTGLSLLDRVGQGDISRQIALQVLLLKRPTL